MSSLNPKFRLRNMSYYLYIFVLQYKELYIRLIIGLYGL